MTLCVCVNYLVMEPYSCSLDLFPDFPCFYSSVCIFSAEERNSSSTRKQWRKPGISLCMYVVYVYTVYKYVLINDICFIKICVIPSFQKCEDTVYKMVSMLVDYHCN